MVVYFGFQLTGLQTFDEKVGWLSARPGTTASVGHFFLTLFELEEASFITAHEPYWTRKSGAVYRLSDEYSLFYLKWIEGRGTKGRDGFLDTEPPGWRAWSGYALESLAFRHVDQIKSVLQIGGLQISAHS